MELLEWDARSYDALPLPHKRWGPGAIARLRLAGDETVADIGAGTGRDAEQLLAALPRGRVLAIDGSQQMLAQLRERLAGQLDRVQVLQADLREPLPVTEPVDAVLSVATLHWLPDHPQVFRSVARLLRPGGQFEAFLATVILGAHLRDLPPAERRPFVRAVAARLPEPVVDYARLQIRATRAAD